MADEPLDEIAEPEEQPGQIQEPSVIDRGQDAYNQYQNAQDLKDLAGKAKEKLAPKEGLKEGVEKDTAEQAERKVVTRGAQQGAQAGVKTAVTAEAEAAVVGGAEVATGAGTAGLLTAEATTGPVGWVAGAITLLAIFGKHIWNGAKKYWPVAVYIIAGIILLPAILFGLLAGKWPPQYPATAGQIQGTTIVASLGSDLLAGRKLTQQTADAEKKRYQIVQANVDQTIPGRSAEVKAKITEITALMESAVAVSGDQKKAMVDRIVAEVNALDRSLPFGSWIAAKAISQVGQPSAQFCTITHASSNVACASVVTTILENAGAEIPINASVDNVWRMAALRIVVNRGAELDRTLGYYEQNKGKLQPGDIIFWGDGSCNPKGSILFDHVGIYVGNGLAVDNSSGQGAIRKPTQAAKRTSCIVFNGAKRYGADL